MPCYDIRSDWDSQHNNVAAELLCSLIGSLPAGDVPWTPQLRQWWDDHQDRDAYYERKSKERR